MKTELEQFWKGEFGNDYTKRNLGKVKNNYAFFQRALYEDSHYDGMHIIEFGAGSGENLKALRELLPSAILTAVEINEVALTLLRADRGINHVVYASILDELAGTGTARLVFTKGVLIHICPEDLPKAYATLYSASSQYILLCEYYNPTPVEVDYRGNKRKLWKRDFAGDMMRQYPDLRLKDYGFVSKYDQYPQDDITYFLLEKSGD